MIASALNFLYRKPLLTGVVCIILLYLPYLFLQENSFIGNPFDYLNSNVIYMKTVVDNNAAFWDNCTSLPNIMHQYRVNYGSELDFIFLLFVILPPFYAILLNSFLICITAFASFFIAVKHFIPYCNRGILFCCSLLFSLLPFWQFGGISIAGFPLLLLFFNHVWYKKEIRWYFYIFILLYLFYSSLIVYLLFIYFFLFVFFVCKAVSERKVNLLFFIILFSTLIIPLAREYRQILFSLNPCFETNRGIFYEIPDIKLSDFFKSITEGNQHAAPLHKPIIALLIFSIIIFRKKLLSDYRFIFFLIYILISEVLSIGLAKVILFPLLDLLHLEFLKGFSLHRFNVVNQFIWYFILVLLLQKIYVSSFVYRKYAISVIIIAVAVNVFKENIPLENIRSAVFTDRHRAHIKYSDYYMLDEYRKIKQILPSDQRRYSVVHYGFDPAASNYHGFITFDGLFPVYSEETNREFNRLIAPLKESDPARYAHARFNMYIVPENYKHTHNFLQNYSKKPLQLNIDTRVLYRNNVQYILSTVPLINREFELKSSVQSKFWQMIYIYKIKKLEVSK
ncbi:DUF6044 family protein [Chryseobacterium caseinilyticum]|uniref:YfhO family protein n=1 Tax=Chryseobacterium caseinilyticum TaxID=2771428 RepID=A0ABR8ZG85_9FLAO|nr:DUF6044 family protein [Chryseobacterium caseinilyticum]MBD8084317.1 hypothetical protein [Chryseobacterium caseinilyticum]